MSTIEITQGTIPTGSYAVDRSHSNAEFTVRHMKISTVRGVFLDFDASLEGGDEPRVTGTIQTGSAVTHDETRDGHLKAPDFFDVERYPEATITGSLVAPDRFEGELTLKGVTKPVTMRATVSGPDTDPWGNERVGLELDGVINRMDHGVDWNAPLPGGGFLLDNEVGLHASLSFVKQA
ncbi:MAG TPA: YceI family protein [Gaiellales bacterium]|nr:YceI family protein [Gaiellales bacterium]